MITNYEQIKIFKVHQNLVTEKKLDKSQKFYRNLPTYLKSSNNFCFKTVLQKTDCKVGRPKQVFISNPFLEVLRKQVMKA